MDEVLNSAVLRPRRQRQYTDKRRQYCKIAARERRSSEADVFQDLGRVLPISQSALKTLDKLSILRLAVTTLKLTKYFGNKSVYHDGLQGYDPDDLLNGEFLIVIAETGEILYVSEGISKLLDYVSWELIGNNLFDYVHSNDKHDLNQLLVAEGMFSTRSGLIRLKCNAFPHIQKKPRKSGGSSSCLPVPVKTKTIHFSGKMYAYGLESQQYAGKSVFIGTGRLLPHPLDNSFPLPFVSRRILTSMLSMTDMGFLEAGESVQDVLRFSPADLSTMKATDLVHWADAQVVLPTFQDLYTKGQSKSEPFRFLVKGGGWVWIIAEASVVRTSESSSAVFCTSFVISDVETNEIVSVSQLELPAQQTRKEIQTLSQSDEPHPNEECLDSFLTENFVDSSGVTEIMSGHHVSHQTQSHTFNIGKQQFVPEDEDTDTTLLESLAEDVVMDLDTLSAFSQAIEGFFETFTDDNSQAM